MGDKTINNYVSLFRYKMNFMKEARQYYYNKEDKLPKKHLLWRLCLVLFLLLPLSYTEVYAQTLDSVDSLSTADDMLAKKGEVLAKGDRDTDRLEAQRYYYKGRLEEAHKEYDKALKLYLKSDSLWSNNATTLHSLAECCRYLHKNAEARLYLEKAYALDSTDRDIVFDLVQSYAQERKYEEASQLMTVWLKQDPKDGNALEFLAKLYYALGQTPEAINCYSRLQALNAQDFDVCKQILRIKGELYHSINEYEKSEQAYEQLVKQFPDELEAKNLLFEEELRLCQHYRSSDEYEETQKTPKIYQKIWKRLEQYQKAKAIPEVMAEQWIFSIYMSNIAFKQALISLDKILAHKDAELKTKMSLLNRFISNQPKADILAGKYNDRWELLLEQEPESSDLRMSYAENLRLQRNFSRAIDVLRPLIKSEPKNKDLWEGLIGDAISLEDIDLISEFCLQAIDCIKEDWRNYFYASVGLYSKKNIKDAKAVLIKGIKVLDSLEHKDRFGLSMLHGQLGDLYGELGKDKEQVQAYDKALELNGNNPSVLNNYAYHLSKKEIRLNDAERMAALGVRLTPDNANLLETYAWILYQTKKYALASLYMTKAIDEGTKTNDVSAIFYEHYGFIHQEQDEKSKAKECFDKALELYQQEFEENAEEKSKQKEIKKAIRRIKKALRKI